MKSNARFDDAMTDVAKIYAHPDDIVADQALSHEQRVKLLKQWEFDLRENMVASEENMTSAPPQEGKTAELLRDVRKALLGIGGADDENKRAAPMKQGGA
jgi:hypothetical protein